MIGPEFTPAVPIKVKVDEFCEQQSSHHAPANDTTTNSAARSKSGFLSRAAVAMRGGNASGDLDVIAQQITETLEPYVEDIRDDAVIRAAACNVLLVLPSEPKPGLDIKRDLRAKLTRQLPEIGPAIAIDVTMSRKLTDAQLFAGAGLYIAGADQSPFASVQFAAAPPPDEARATPEPHAVATPKLLGVDRETSSAAEAGWYRMQAGMTVGFGGTSAPAQVALDELPLSLSQRRQLPEYVLHIGRYRPWGEIALTAFDANSHARRLVKYDPIALSGGHWTRIEFPEAHIWLRIAANIGGGEISNPRRIFDVPRRQPIDHVSLEMPGSAAPDGPTLEVRGLCIPRARILGSLLHGPGLPSPEAWRVDFTRSGELSAGPLDEVAFSLVGERLGRYGIYDHVPKGERITGEFVRAKTTGTQRYRLGGPDSDCFIECAEPEERPVANVEDLADFLIDCGRYEPPLMRGNIIEQIQKTYSDVHGIYQDCEVIRRNDDEIMLSISLPQSKFAPGEPINVRFRSSSPEFSITHHEPEISLDWVNRCASVRNDDVKGLASYWAAFLKNLRIRPYANHLLVELSVEFGNHNTQTMIYPLASNTGGFVGPLFVSYRGRGNA